MTQHRNSIENSALGCNLDEPVSRTACGTEAKVDGTPVNGHQGLGPESLEQSERRIGIDVDTSVERPLPRAVVPDRKHAADRQEGGIDRKALPDFIEEREVAHVDITCVIDDRVVPADDKTNASRRVAFAPATVVVAGPDAGDLERAKRELIARLDFRDRSEAEIGDNAGRTLGNVERGALFELGERPAVEMIDVAVGDEDRAIAELTGSPAPEGIDEHALATEADMRTSVTDPSDGVGMHLREGYHLRTEVLATARGLLR